MGPSLYLNLSLFLTFFLQVLLAFLLLSINGFCSYVMKFLVGGKVGTILVLFL